MSEERRTMQTSSRCIERSLIQETINVDVTSAYFLTSFVAFHKTKHKLSLYSFREKEYETAISAP